jgi:hypothetical protein
MPVYEPHELPELQQEFAIIAEGLESVGPHEDAWSIELTAAGALPAATHPDTPAELVELLVEALVARGDPLAAGVLTALARLSHDPLASIARDAVAELRQAGVSVPYDDDIGALRVAEVIAHDMDGEAVAYTYLLQRPGTPDLTQGGLVIFEVSDGQRRLVQVETVDPESVEAGRRRLEADLVDPTPRPATAAELLEAFEDAMRSTGSVPEDMLLDLAILERGLTGADLRLPRPPIFLADEDPEENEGVAGRLVHQMIEEGVDPSDPDALAAWMADFNGRTWEERGAMIGPSKGRSGKAKGKQKSQRRQAKAARRRNRRR